MSIAAARRVEGTVRAMSGDDPIGNVEVMISDIGLRARTSEDGRFRLDSVPPGGHIVRATGSGYRPFADTLRMTAVEGWRLEVRMADQSDVATRCHAPFPILPVR